MSDKTLDKKEIIESDISEIFNPFPGLRPFGVEETYLFFVTYSILWNFTRSRKEI